MAKGRDEAVATGTNMLIVMMMVKAMKVQNMELLEVNTELLQGAKERAEVAAAKINMTATKATKDTIQSLALRHQEGTSTMEAQAGARAGAANTIMASAALAALAMEARDTVMMTKKQRTNKPMLTPKPSHELKLLQVLKDRLIQIMLQEERLLLEPVTHHFSLD